MTPRRWWRLAVIAAALYILYDLAPLPDLRADLHRIIVGALTVILAISGTAVLFDRQIIRERERQLADAPTQQLRPVGRVQVVEARPKSSGIDPEVLSIARRLTRRLRGDDDVRH